MDPIFKFGKSLSLREDYFWPGSRSRAEWYSASICCRRLGSSRWRLGILRGQL